MMLTWLYGQDFTKFPLNHHYNVRNGVAWSITINITDDGVESSYSREQRLKRDHRHPQNQCECESQEQHDIRVTKQCDRFHELQGQRIMTSESEENRQR
ncbi:hypothetical protein TNCV_1427921 [Trichonephila clavipes]|nr:hypothetical protein TNCV_1427921 [Trichonephila clavipes]